MGKIYYLIGKSASGKDRMFAALKEHFGAQLRPVVMYTTRPIRSGETEGVAYHFIGAETFERFRAEGKVIESRLYHTVYGPWIYATLDDGQLAPQEHSSLIEGTLESFIATRDYFGAEAVVPLYLEVETGERLARALGRERAQEHPRYAELCRRFLADEEDFSEEKLKAAGIVRRFVNDDFERCLTEITETIEEDCGRLPEECGSAAACAGGGDR